MLAAAMAAIALAFTVIALIARRQPVSTIPRLILSVGSIFVPLAALVGLVLAVLSRRALLTIFAVFLVTATVAIQVSWYYVRHPAELGPHADIRVLSSNLRYGRVDPTAFVGLATTSADVITVAELTPEAVTRFTEVGIEAAFPYSLLVPGPGAGGIGLWSRYPIVPLSTPRHRGVSIEQTGSGFAPTFPADTWFPPVITIEHVLTRKAEASWITTIEMPGSDHRSLLATIRVPLEQ